MYFPNGSRCTYNASFVTKLISFAPSSAAVIAGVTNALAAEGILVEDSQDTTPGILSWGNELIVLKVLNDGTDYFDSNDMKSIIDHAFYIAYGQLPDSSSITSVTVPGGMPIDTGAPPPTNPNAPSSTASNVATWFQKLSAGATGASLGLIIGVVGVIGLLIYVGVRPQTS